MNRGTGHSAVRFLGAWFGLTVLLVVVLWGALGGFDADAVIWVLLLATVVAGGFVAGAVCWARGHRLVGAVGLLAPAAPVVGHGLALRFGDEETWAPTMVGDLLGVMVAIVASLVALLGALVTRSGRGTPVRETAH